LFFNGEHSIESVLLNFNLSLFWLMRNSLLPEF
jgi:hypothetical protein